MQVSEEESADETLELGFGFWRSSQDPERVMTSNVTRWQEEERQHRQDFLTVEEPFEVRVNGRSMAVIMRTPGHDAELAMGFLFTEGVIVSAEEVLKLEETTDEDGLPLANVLNIALHSQTSGDEDTLDTLAPQPISSAFERHFAVSASCGLCGKNSISDLICSAPPLEEDGMRIAATTLYTLPEQLRSAQTVFTSTGGLHAAGLFTIAGQQVLLREDIGRHNAVDKLIGHSLLHGHFPLSHSILMVSGRTSFEILQKALLARIPCVAAISAPSSMAVELAERGGITLIGFLRNRSMNVYTHPERVV